MLEITNYKELKWSDGTTTKVPVEINGVLKLDYIRTAFFLCDDKNTLYKVHYDDTYSNRCAYRLAIKKPEDEYFSERFIHGIGDMLVGLTVLAYEHCIKSSSGRCWGDYTYLTSYNKEQNLVNFPNEHWETGIPGFNGVEKDPVEPEYPDMFDSTIKTRICFDSSD